MANLPYSQKIEFLIERKFGAGARHADTVFPVSLSTGRGSRQNPELAKNVAEYRTKLKSLSPDELSALADSEWRKRTAQLTAKAEREERERFFSLT